MKTELKNGVRLFVAFCLTFLWQVVNEIGGLTFYLSHLKAWKQNIFWVDSVKSTQFSWWPLGDPKQNFFLVGGGGGGSVYYWEVACCEK